MEIVTAVSTVLVAIVVFGLVSLVCTFPGWLIGKVAARRRRDMRSAFLVATKRRRWIVWILGSIVAIVALNFFYRGSSVAWFIALAAGSALAQYAAYSIGFVSTSVSMNYDDPGAPLVIPGEVVERPEPPTERLPRPEAETRPVRPAPTSIEEDLLQAEDEGYSRPTHLDN